MSGMTESIMKRGYMPLAFDTRGAISWQGEYLHDFWMWNRQFMEYAGGIKHAQTVRVMELGEAALRYWRDRWVPLKPVDGAFLRRLEDALRNHAGLKAEGARFPEGAFLEMPEDIPQEYLSPEARKHLGLEKKDTGKLVRKDRLSKRVLDAYRKTLVSAGAKQG